MGRADFFVKGAHNAICDRCGEKRKSYDLRLEWTNLLVCSECYEPRHPQQYVKGRADRQAVPNPRPEGPDRFQSEGVQTPADSYLPFLSIF